MMKTMIIGVGNEYRSDDRIGLLAARYLKEKISGVEIVEFNGDGTDLLHHFKNAGNLIVIDAIECWGNHNPGELLTVDINQVDIKEDINCYSSHSFSFADAVNTAKVLSYFPENAYLIGVYSKVFDFGEKLSFDYNRTLVDIELNVNQIIAEFKCNISNTVE